MNQEAQLKKALKESYCYLEVMLKKYEILKSEKDKDYQLFSQKYEDFKHVVEEAKMADKCLKLKNEQLEEELAKSRTKLEEFKDSSMERQKALERELINKDGQLVLLRQQTNIFQKQLNDLDEELAITKFQAETFRNDFNLERECREKLNDEKLRLEEELEGSRMGAFNFHRVNAEPLAVTDSRRTSGANDWHPVSRDT